MITRPSRLRSQLLLLISIALAPALVLILYGFADHRRHHIDEARIDALRLARLIATDGEKSFESARQLVTSLSQVAVIREDQHPECRELLSHLHDLSATYANLGVIDSRGYVTCSAHPLTRSVNRSNSQWFEQAMRTGTFTTGTFEIGPISGKPIIVVACPIQLNGPPSGVVYASMDLGSLGRILHHGDFPAGTVVVITDRDGRILAREPENASLIGRKIEEVEVSRVARLMMHDGTIEVAGRDGVTRLWASHLARLDGKAVLSVAVGIPADVAYAATRRTLIQSLLLLSLVTALVFMMAWYGSETVLLKRMRQLVHASEGISGGDFKVRSGIRTDGDELGQLAGAFDEMASSLQLRDERVREAEDELRAGEARYHELFQMMPLPAWVFDEETLKYVDVNDAAVKLYGYSRDEFTRMTLRDVRLPEDMPELFRKLATLGKPEDTLEARHILRDGSIRRMVVSLRRLTWEGRPAIMGVMSDITERSLAEERQAAYAQQLRGLAQRLQSVREDERASMAREVHDELGQALTGLKMDLSWLRMRLDSLRPGLDLEMLSSRIGSMLELVDATVSSVRRIATELRPAILDTLGLVPALEWLSRDFHERMHIPCTFSTIVIDLKMPPDAATAVFRIVQETLTNIARHSGATAVRIRLEECDGLICLSIEDNGKGISQADLSRSGSFGLLGMKERAAVIGADLRVEGLPGRGTTVLLQFSSPDTGLPVREQAKSPSMTGTTGGGSEE